MPIFASNFTSNSLSGSLVTADGFANVNLTTIPYALEGNKTFVIKIRRGGPSGDVLATSNPITLTDNSSVVSLTANTATVNEGGLVSFSVVTANAVNNSNIYFSVFPATANVTASDFVGNTGIFSIINNTGTFALKTAADLSIIDETGENFRVQLRTNAPNGNVVFTTSNIAIQDTSYAYNIVSFVESSVSPVVEGSNVTFTLTATNIPLGTIFYYSTVGNVTSFSSNTGSFALNSTSNTFVISNPQVPYNASRSFNVILRSDSAAGPIVATSNTINVLDNALIVVSASGGTQSNVDGYRIHTFTTSSNVTILSSGEVEYLVVAGGGGAGSQGGGGAGGFRTATGLSVIAGSTFTVTVGAGGTGGNSANTIVRTKGTDSVFSSITSAGGGHGGNYGAPVAQPGSSGGSGGGGGGTTGGDTFGTGGAGNIPSVSPSQGNNGADGTRDNAAHTGGGGGGAFAAAVGRLGGNGANSSITGSSVTYSGGGSGGGTTSLAGGTGGGGSGAATGLGGTAGTTNTGGGGGGGGTGGAGTGGNGGSGIVIIKYRGTAGAFVNVTTPANFVYEGSNVVFRLNTTNVANNTLLYYYTVGNVLTTDFVTGNTGSFRTTENSTNITLPTNTTIPALEEKFFQLIISGDAGTSADPLITSNIFTIKDSNLYTVFGLVESIPSPIVAESNVTFTFNAFVPNGTLLYYSTSGNTTSFLSNTGSFVMNGTSNTFVISNPQVPFGTSRSFNVIVRRDSVSGSIIATSNTIVVLDDTLVTMTASGGTQSNISGYRIHTFTTSGNIVFNNAGGVEYLVIAGGGGGGSGDNQNGDAGGGGAGGFRTAAGFSVSPNSIITVTVGAGGAGGPAYSVNGSQGANSVFSTTITAAGGGYGVTNSQTGGNGGSGGGGGGRGAFAGGAGNTPAVSPSQGNPGGAGAGSGPSVAGGGGGAGAAGGNGGGGIGGTGGIGANSSITGTAVTYAGGGGTGGGAAGSGGGGTGNSPGTVNTGGGGGGASAGGGAGGNGGSGIVIIRYRSNVGAIVNITTTENFVYEGANAIFTLNTSQAANNTLLYYYTVGNVLTTDFVTGNTGSFRTTQNSTTIRLESNTTIPTNEERSFQLVVSNNIGNSGDILLTSNVFTIKDIGLKPPYDFTVSPAVNGITQWSLVTNGSLILNTANVLTIVPNNTFNANVSMWGPGGGNAIGNGAGPATRGGAGGATTGLVTFNNGVVYTLFVGAAGTSTSAGRTGAGGGSASGILLPGNVEVMIAGGGGGAAEPTSRFAGAGGGSSGQPAQPGGGFGGTESAAGAGGDGGRRVGAPGSGTSGGRGALGSVAVPGGTSGIAGQYTGGAGTVDGGDSGSGGGGAGHFGGGGGGGDAGGFAGGGGSGYYNPAYVINGVNYTGSNVTCGNSNGAGRGNAGNSANVGLIIISQ
jgi:hypothetical protein